MRDDKTGWEIVFSGRESLLPPRDSHPSDIWVGPAPHRRYVRSGKYRKKACDHKFIGSTCCLKCGWTPAERSENGSLEDTPQGNMGAKHD